MLVYEAPSNPTRTFSKRHGKALLQISTHSHAMHNTQRSVAISGTGSLKHATS